MEFGNRSLKALSSCKSDKMNTSFKGLGKVPVIEQLDLKVLPKGIKTKFLMHLVTDGLSMPIYVPLLVAVGELPGDVLGLTAAIHGNELNGIPVIQRLFKELDVQRLRGIVVGVPVVNVPSYLRRERRFLDGVDLNHIMPGEQGGNVSSVYAWRFFDRIVRQFNYLVDLHTASFGRINSYYIRADMSNAVTRQMALLQNPQIILHNKPSDGTLRGAANALGIHAITLEVGNPNTFQRGMVREGLTGLHNLLHFLQMFDSVIEKSDVPPVICHSSQWLYADQGGLLSVIPDANTYVAEGEQVARIHNIFGDIVQEYAAPKSGIVIGKEVNPVNQTGGRILHLGFPGEP